MSLILLFTEYGQKEMEIVFFLIPDSSKQNSYI